MVATVGSVEVYLRTFGVERFQTDMRGMASISEQTGSKVKRSMEGITSSAERASRAGESFGRSSSAFNSLALSALRAETSITGLSRAFTALGAVVGGLAGGVALNTFKNYADQATNIQNRLAAVIPVQSQRAQIDQQIFETAQRTRTSYESTANIFSRMTLSASNLGATQAQILRTVEITQKALQAGGATTAESASIATQLTQALGAGRLNGDELKSIAENSPVLIQAIAKEFGVGVGALKDLGAEGKLTADRVFKAILNAGEEVDAVFARTTPTIAAGIQQIDNALTRYIGNVDKSIGATKALVGGLEFVARNLDSIGDGAALAVAALAGPLAGRLLTGAATRVTAPYRDARAEAASRTASTVEAAKRAADARLDAEIRLMEAQEKREALEKSPRFRQAAPDVQRAYEQQAKRVDSLREAAAITAERETAALLKRADAEGMVAQASETATSRAERARARLAKRETELQELIARRAQAESKAAEQLDRQITRQEQRVEKARISEARAIENEARSQASAARSLPKIQADADLEARAATAQRRSATQGLSEAERRLGDLAGQVGPSAAAQRTKAIQEVEAAQNVLTRAVAADAAAQASAAAATAQNTRAKAALSSAARTASGAFTGLVGLLGGPLGAALTAASVGTAGYLLYQERAAAQVEEHKKAVDRLIDSTRQLNELNAQGRISTVREQVDATNAAKGALRSTIDSRNSLKEALASALGRATATGGYTSDNAGGVDASRPLTTIDAAAAKAGLSIEGMRAKLDQLNPGTKEGAALARQLADALLQASTTDAKLGDIAAKADDIARGWEKAASAVDGYAKARQSTPTLLDSPLDYARTTAPVFNANPAIEAFKAQIKEVKDQILSLGDTDISIEGLDTSREQIVGFLQDIVEARANAMGALSNKTVPTEIYDLVQAFGNGEMSASAYAVALQDLAQKFPSFQPLIASLTDTTQKALAAEGQIQSLGASVRGLDGLIANIRVKLNVDGVLPNISALAASEQAKADAALNKVEQANRVLALRAAGKDVDAKVLEAQQANPALDADRARRVFAEQDRLNAQISANRKAARGGGKGRKSPEQRNEEKLAKKLEELDQDAKVAALNDFDQKTVRFAQSAKVASEQIQAFIAAARSGDMTSIPPTMQEIYDKMRLLEGVKLGKSALDDLFPGRLLAEQIESVRRAAQSSPEIAANLDLIEQRLREKGAPEWAKNFTSSFTDMVKGVATGTATMADALATFKTRVMNLALDAAFKPLERMLTGFLGGGGGDGLTGFSNLFSGMFGGATAGPSPTGGVRLFADGYIAKGPGTGRSDSILARISNGEAVIPAHVVSANRPLVEALVKDRLPKFADGRMPDLGALTAGSLAMQEARLAAAPSPNLPSNRDSGMVTEVYVSGGDKTGAETTMGPRGPRTEITIDKTIAAALLSGSETRAALKKLTGGRMTGG